MGLAASKQEAFWESCGFGRVSAVKKFIEDGIDVNWVSYTHNSCAIHVASQGKKEIVQMLIDAKCNINAKDDRGNLALHHAAMKGHANIIQMLLDAGSEINTKEKNDWTALINAAYFCHFEAVEVLLKNNCDAHIMNKDQRTALHEACRSHSTDENALAIIACLLIEAGCDLDAKSSDVGEADFTALMFTAYHGHAEVADALAEAGCDINAQGSNGWSALHWAADRGHKAVVDVLLHWEINPLLKGRRGEIALDRAQDNEIRELIQEVTVQARQEKDMEEMLSRSPVSTTSPMSSRTASLGSLDDDHPITAAPPITNNLSAALIQRGSHLCQLEKRPLRQVSNEAAIIPAIIPADDAQEETESSCTSGTISEKDQNETLEKDMYEDVSSSSCAGGSQLDATSPMSDCPTLATSTSSGNTSQASVVETDVANLKDGDRVVAADSSSDDAPNNLKNSPDQISTAPAENTDSKPSETSEGKGEFPPGLEGLCVRDDDEVDPTADSQPAIDNRGGDVIATDPSTTLVPDMLHNGEDAIDIGNNTRDSNTDTEVNPKPNTVGGDPLRHPAVQALLPDHHGNDADDGNFSDDLLEVGGYSEDLIDSDMDM